MFDLSVLEGLVAKLPEVIAQGEAFVAAHKDTLATLSSAVEAAKAPKSKDEVVTEISKLLDLLKTL